MTEETQAADTGQETDGGGMEPDAARARMDEISVELADAPNMRGTQPSRYRQLTDERRRLAEIVVADEERRNPTEFPDEESARRYLHDRQKAAAIRKDDATGGLARLDELHGHLDALSEAVDGADIGLTWLDDLEIAPPGVSEAVQALSAVQKRDLDAAAPLLDKALDGFRAGAETRDAVQRVVAADLPEALRAMLAADVLFWALDAHAPTVERNEQ